MIVNIADINIELEGFEQLKIENKFKMYQPGYNGLADMTIRGKILPYIEEPVGETTDSIEGWQWCFSEKLTSWFFKQNSKVVSKIDFSLDFKKADIYTVESHKGSFLTTNEKMWLLIRQAFWNMVTVFDGIVFHSSAISYKNNALLFSAPSGTGKSTQTRMWVEEFGESAVYINDDTPIVRIINGDIMVYGAPWSGKNSINNPIKAPLKGIIAVRQGVINKITELKGIDMFYRIYNESKKPAVKELIEKYMDVVSYICEHTKMIELCCKIDKETVYMVKNEFSLK